MDKRELINTCNKLYKKLEEINNFVDDIKSTMKNVMYLAEELPTEESDIDNTEEK